MTKKPIEILSEVSGLLPSTIESNYKWVLEAMKQYTKQESIEFMNWTVENLYHSCTDLKVFWWEHSSSEKQYTTEQLYELYQLSKK